MNHILHRIARQSALLIAFTAAAPAFAADSTRALDEFSRLIVTGDGRAALRSIEQVAPQARTGKESDVYACVSARLQEQPAETPPAFLAAKPVAWRIVQAYRSYWRASLGGAPEHEAQAALLAQLNAALAGDKASWDKTSLDDTSSEVKRYLVSQGLHAITGVTRPYYELMLWTDETGRDYRVDLSDEVVTVPVTFMDGFASRGWLHYATCEWFGAGGWTANGRLFAIRSSYDLDSEQFRVSYLGHEGRHFADNRAYPKLEQPELEYRAKLTELVLSRETTRKLLRKFVTSEQTGRAAPHPHAEHWVARGLQQRLFAGSSREPREEAWDTVTDAQVREAATALLAQSTAQAQKGTARFLPD